ncbi:hypothetical protein [Dinoroseobacter sp. S124A]|uniref:hypothetical protein n=1 Tax=Dinoroseobacter sp. S124A TaxID=3415128 RepID=UPI003C7BB2E7
MIVKRSLLKLRHSMAFVVLIILAPSLFFAYGALTAGEGYLLTLDGMLNLALGGSGILLGIALMTHCIRGYLDKSPLVSTDEGGIRFVKRTLPRIKEERIHVPWRDVAAIKSFDDRVANRSFHEAKRGRKGFSVETTSGDSHFFGSIDFDEKLENVTVPLVEELERAGFSIEHIPRQRGYGVAVKEWRVVENSDTAP